MKFILVSLLLIQLIGCGNFEKKIITTFAGEAIGTTYLVKCSNCSQLNVNQKIDSIVVLFNQSLSTYNDSSIISKINSGKESVQTDELFRKVFNMSKEVFEQTDGYFDPSVGGLVNRYGFGSKKSAEKSNLPISILKKKTVGFDEFYLTKTEVVKKDKDSRLDFNGIAKGYLVDLIADELEKKGVENFLVEMGGEIRASGFKKNNKPWVVGIDAPNEDGTRSIWTKINLENKSMATSGNYRKFLTDGQGNKTVHTVNPKTGLAQENKLLSVSVVGNIACAYLDAYATAFLAMGLEKTKKFLQNRPKILAILIFIDENSKIQTSFINFTHN